MRNDQVRKGILAAAQLNGRTDWVVIGSQAIHGTVQDPPLDVIVRSEDVDTYPLDYDEPMFIRTHTELGYDSDFWEENGFYVEIVRPGLARFPPGWETRATTEVIGEAAIAGAPTPVRIIYPEIHDLAASKLSVGRERDYEFLHGVVELSLVRKNLLEQRLRDAPSTTAEKLAEGLAAIGAAFEAREQTPGNAQNP